MCSVFLTHLILTMTKRKIDQFIPIFRKMCKMGPSINQFAYGYTAYNRQNWDINFAYFCFKSHYIRSVQSLSQIWLFVTPWTAAHQASLSIIKSQSPLKPMSIESVMPSNHLILCRPLLLPPSIFPSIRVFSQMSQLFVSGGQSIGVSALASVLPMNTQDWSPLGWTHWISLQSKGLSRVFSNTTVQKHQFFGSQLSSQSNSHIHTWPQEKP